MLVIAIIGILVTLAVPTYRDHAIRARVTEGLALAEVAKLAVSEYVITNHTLPESQAIAGYVGPAATTNVQAITIASQGVIQIHYTELAGNGAIELIPHLQGSGEIKWTCNKGSLAKHYRPANCR